MSKRRKKFYPPQEACENARATLALREALPKSRRGGLEADEAERQGILSGVEKSKELAASEGEPLEDYQPYLRSLKRFRGMAYRAMDEGKGPENSKAIQVFLMWGGDAMIEAVEKHIAAE